MTILVVVEIIARFVQGVRILVEIQKHTHVRVVHVILVLPLLEVVTPVLIREVAAVRQPAIQV